MSNFNKIKGGQILKNTNIQQLHQQLNPNYKKTKCIKQIPTGPI